MSEWIKFHAELTKGAKRGLPRSVRFVYLELSLLSRPGSGSIDLATGMSDCAAVSDMLGGNSREVREAVALLSAGDDPMIRFEGPKDRRRLIIVAWERWNERPGRSTERVQRHRNAHVTRYTPVTNGDETVAERSGNAPRGEREKRREDPHPQTPPQPSPAEPSSQTPPPASGGGGAKSDMRSVIAEVMASIPALAEFGHAAGVEALAASAVMAGRKPEAVADALRHLGVKATTGGWSRNRIEGALSRAVQFAKLPESPPSDPKPTVAEPAMLRSPTPAEVAHAQAAIDKRRAWLLSLSGDVQAPTPAPTTQNCAGDPAAREQSTIQTTTGHTDPELASA